MNCGGDINLLEKEVQFTPIIWYYTRLYTFADI